MEQDNDEIIDETQKNKNDGYLGQDLQNQKQQMKKSVKSSRKGRGNLQEMVDLKRSIKQSTHKNAMKKSFDSKSNANRPENLITIQEIVKTDKGNVGFEDGRETNALFSDYLIIEVACSCLNLIGVFLTVIEYDLEYDERNEEVARSICYCITVSSIISIVLTFLRFQANLDWMIARGVKNKGETLFTSGLIWGCLFELILVVAGPLPWTVNERIYFNSEPAGLDDIYYHVNEILSLILMLRGLLIFRTFLMLSQWYNNRSQRVCKLYNCNSNLLFVVKCIMKEQPYSIVSFAFIVSIFYFGFLIRVCESPLARDPSAQNFHSYFNALWNIIITMTTVGYGDYYAQTELGRFVIFIVSIWGVFIVSIMVVTMTNTLSTSNLENKAIAVLDRLFVRDQMKHQASNVITTIGKINILKKSMEKNKAQHQKNGEKKMNELIVNLRKNVNEYKRINRQYRSICDDNISEEMSRQFDFMREEFRTLFVKQQVVLEANVEIMKHLQMDKEKISKFEDFCDKQNEKMLQEFNMTDPIKAKKDQEQDNQDYINLLKHNQQEYKVMQEQIQEQKNQQDNNNNNNEKLKQD